MFGTGVKDYWLVIETDHIGRDERIEIVEVEVYLTDDKRGNHLGEERKKKRKKNQKKQAD